MPMPLKVKNIRRKLKAYLLKLRKNWPVPKIVSKLAIICSSKLEEYAFGLECLYRYKKCTLSEKEEQIIASFETILGTGDDAFGNLDNADVKFADVVKDGKKMPLNHSNYSNFMIDKDREVRKDAFKKLKM